MSEMGVKFGCSSNCNISSLKTSGANITHQYITWDLYSSFKSMYFGEFKQMCHESYEIQKEAPNILDEIESLLPDMSDTLRMEQIRLEEDMLWIMNDCEYLFQLICQQICQKLDEMKFEMLWCANVVLIGHQKQDEELIHKLLIGHKYVIMDQKQADEMIYDTQLKTATSNFMFEFENDGATEYDEMRLAEETIWNLYRNMRGRNEEEENMEIDISQAKDNEKVEECEEMEGKAKQLEAHPNVSTSEVKLCSEPTKSQIVESNMENLKSNELMAESMENMENPRKLLEQLLLAKEKFGESIGEYETKQIKYIAEINRLPIKPNMQVAGSKLVDQWCKKQWWEFLNQFSAPIQTRNIKSEKIKMVNLYQKQQIPLEEAIRWILMYGADVMMNIYLDKSNLSLLEVK